MPDVHGPRTSGICAIPRNVATVEGKPPAAAPLRTWAAATRSSRLGPGGWGPVAGAWWLGPRTRGLVPGVWWLGPRTWCRAPGAEQLVAGAWCVAARAWCVAARAYCVAPRSSCHVPNPCWCLPPRGSPTSAVWQRLRAAGRPFALARTLRASPDRRAVSHPVCRQITGPPQRGHVFGPVWTGHSSTGALPP